MAARGPAPCTVTHQRAEHGGDLWAAATHDGYQANFGLMHGASFSSPPTATTCAARIR